MVVLSLLLLADALLGFFLLTTYGPPFLPYLLAIVVTVALFVLARRLPVGNHGTGDHKGRPYEESEPHPHKTPKRQSPTHPTASLNMYD